MATRVLLLEAAARTLALHGEPSLSLENVAREAAVSKASVVYHFGTRNGLLDAVHERLLDEWRLGLERLRQDFAVHPRARLTALVEALFSESRDLGRRGARNLHTFWLGETARGVPRNFERIALLRAFLSETMREGVRAGELSRLTDPRGAEERLVASWLGAQNLWASGVDVDLHFHGALALREIVRPRGEK